MEAAPYTKESDVFSFGMMMWEILTNCTPFEGRNALQVCMFVACLAVSKCPN